MTKSEKNTYMGKVLKRLPRAALAGFCAGATFFFFGILDIFAGNRDELLFSFSDFGIYILLIALGASLALTATIAFLPEIASNVVFGVVVWLCLMGYIQAALLNGAGVLNGDTGQSIDVGFAIIDGAIWLAVGAVCVIGAIKMRKKSIIKSISAIILIVLIAMQATGCVMQAGEITRSPFESAAVVSEPVGTKQSADQSTEESTQSSTAESTSSAFYADVSKAYLTREGLTEVSPGKNVIIFVVDRFDISYSEDIIKDDPSFFDGLDGFTYFDDNISLYSRTYPGITSMITGVENDFSGTAAEYFAKAYQTSDFLRDLKANNYKIKLYTANYYAYRDGTPLYGIADNLSVATDYTVKNTAALVSNLIALSAYKYLPTALKGAVNISTASFTGIIDYNGDAPLYELDDTNVYEEIHENGLSFDDSENSYILIHLSGCHDPYTMDEDGTRVEKSSAERQLRGNFKLIYEYIGELKRLGVYDDATIIITGDHPRALDDAEIPSQPRLTALFVKPAGATNTFRYSPAQVSQANLIPTIVKSAGIVTEKDYGDSYFDVSIADTPKRYHKFELYVKGEDDRIVTFKVVGFGRDFENWEIASSDPVEMIYK